MNLRIKSSILWIRVFRESIAFALHSLSANRLRTLLALLGITIGIFAIISVFTVINSLERAIRNQISQLGDNIVYVQKWPMNFGPGFQWWKYVNRPEVDYRELAQVQERSQTLASAGMIIQGQLPMRYKENTTEGSYIVACTEEYEQIRSFDIENGRFISSGEFYAGNNVVVIGKQIVDDLFQDEDPIGKSMFIATRKVTVVGVFKKEGEGMMTGSHDMLVLTPLNYARTLINIRYAGVSPTIMAKAKPNVATEEMVDELTGIMRSIRQLKPMEDDNFSINTISMINNAFDQIFVTINLAGFIIGGFAILVGGFGIANIMFVSVRERTKIIGIQKAIGAKNWAILYQFLFEAVTLSIIGGIFGLLIILLGIIIANSLMDFKLVLGIQNILLGLGISAGIGIISGFAPAYKASRLNPVEAIGTV